MGVSDDILTFLETGRIAEDVGCAAIALHARTAEQLYSGSARWEAIGELKQAITSIPVLGNGDIWEPADALAMMRETDCDGVVVGRGCLGRPWLFGALAAAFDAQELPPLPTFGEVSAMMLRHAEMLVEWYGDESSLRQFRKHALWYLMGFPIGGEMRNQFAIRSRPTCFVRRGATPVALDRSCCPSSGCRIAIATSPSAQARTRSSAVAESEDASRPRGTERTLLLGSASPRRADLLAAAGYSFDVVTAPIDEQSAAAGIGDGDIAAATRAIARAKFDALSAALGHGPGHGAHDLAAGQVARVLTADTLVACAGVTMGKPTSNEEVVTTLSHLSGQRISITTSLCIGDVSLADSRAGDAGAGESVQPTQVEETTTVDLRTISTAEMHAYAATGVGLDKAAGLALQAEAAPFIAAVQGCWSNVLGLPICRVRALVGGGGRVVTQICAGRSCGQ